MCLGLFYIKNQEIFFLQLNFDIMTKTKQKGKSMNILEYVKHLLKDSKKLMKLIVMAGAVFVSLYLLYIYTWAASCSFYLADDFAHASSIGTKYMSIIEVLAISIGFMTDKYMNWQGTFFSMFLQAFLSPLNGGGAIQLKIVMVSNIILLYASIFAMFCAVCKRVLGKIVWHYVLPVNALLLFAINAFQVWTEIYYWYSGAISYSIPFSFTCLAITMYLLSDMELNKKKKSGWAVGAAICLFLACGGSLQVAGTSCYIVLLLALMSTWKERKISLYKWGIFVSGLSGALINTLAPGNYARYEATGGESKLYVFRAISGVLLKVKEEADWMINKVPFVAVLLLAVAIGVFVGQYIKYKKCGMLLFSVALLMTPLVTMFPVTLAYYASYFPNRCRFILDLVMMGICLFIALEIGCMLHDVFSSQKEKLQLVTFCVLLAIVSFSSNETYNFGDLNMVTTEIALDSGAIQNYSRHCMDIYNYIEQSEEADVVITELPLTLPTYTKLLLTDDPTFWINEELSAYFGKNSIRAVYQQIE